MLKTLALKELRETIGITALALILFANYVFNGMGVYVLPTSARGGSWIPFVSDPLLPFFAAIAVLLAVVLGFRQSIFESAFGTYQFLLHRPVSRGNLIGVKLAVGVSMLVICSALPVLAYAWWAATPGTHPSPFEWSMTEPFWRIPLVSTMVYLGSFLSGIRPARWVGTRLVPLAAVAFLAVIVAAGAPYFDVLPAWWIWWAGVVVLVDAVLLACILFAFRTRDF
jgi:hypothetical protein